MVSESEYTVSAAALLSKRTKQCKFKEFIESSDDDYEVDKVVEVKRKKRAARSMPALDSSTTEATRADSTRSGGAAETSTSTLLMTRMPRRLLLQLMSRILPPAPLQLSQSTHCATPSDPRKMWQPRLNRKPSS